MNEKKQSLKTNLVFNFISQILTLIIPLITTPYLSRILHEEGNGQISYSLSVISFFILFASLGFTTYGQREIAKVRDDKKERSKTFWEIVILKSLSTLASGIVFFCIFYTSGFKKCDELILIFSIELFSTMFDITFFFQGEENFKSLAIRNILLKVLGLILIFCFVQTSDDTWIYALCLSISLLFSYIIMWPSLKGKIIFIRPSALSFKRHLLPTLRIFIPQLAATVYTTMDKLMIGWFSSNSDYDNGCYDQAYKINSAALLLVIVISPVLAPRNTYDYTNHNSSDFKRHINFSIQYTWMIGLPLIAGFSVLSYNLSSWYLGSGYAEVPLLLQIMSVRFVFSGFSELCSNQIFVAIGKEKYSTIATIISAVLNCILDYFFIIKMGSIGAAITTAICEFVVSLILVLLAVKKGFFSFKDLFSPFWKYFLSSLVMFLVIFFIQKYMGYSVWTFILITFVGIVVYFMLLLVLRDKFLIYWVKKGLGKISSRKSKK